MIAPKCCNKPMELKAVRVVGTVQFSKPSCIKTKIYYYFQCKKCGKFEYEDRLE